MKKEKGVVFLLYCGLCLTSSNLAAHQNDDQSANVDVGGGRVLANEEEPLSGQNSIEDSAHTSVEESEYRLFSEEEVAAIPIPDLAFVENESVRQDYEKYFYFHRDGVGFSQAYADITECDQLSSGLNVYSGTSESYAGYYASQYGVGGVAGSVLGTALGDLIHGSAARRKIRRINMRNCMGFKGYQRYGLKKDLWTQFNFEEGNGRKRDEIREAALLQQARVASGPKPESEELGI